MKKYADFFERIKRMFDRLELRTRFFLQTNVVSLNLKSLRHLNTRKSIQLKSRMLWVVI